MILTETPKPRRAITRAITAARDSPQTAVEIIEDELKEQRTIGTDSAVGVLARQAGTFCIAAGELGRALEYYDEARKLCPTDPYIHFGCGQLRLELGHVGESETDLKKCIEVAEEQGEQDLMCAAQDLLSRIKDSR